MYKNTLLVLMLLVCAQLFSQVGIATTSPTATLDVNGDFRIRTITEELNFELAKDSILIISRDGTIKRISSRLIIDSALQSAVKGNFSGSGDLNLTLGSGSTYTTLPFDNEEFDHNDEFDTTTNTFTAKQDGIYDISVQINSNAGIAVSSDYGICILKNGTIVAKEDYENINVSVLAVNLDVTPPVRKTNTLVQLNTGDTISFQLFSDLSVVDLSAEAIDSFFTIVQIR